MTTYKAVHNAIVDQNGKQIAVVLATSCTRKLAIEIATVAAEWLNQQEFEKELRAAAAIDEGRQTK